MSVCTRKDGTVFVQFKLNGKQKRKYFGKGTGALLEATNYNDQREKPTSALQGPTFKELSVAYLAARKNIIAASTWMNMRFKLRGVIVPLLDCNAYDLTPSKMERYVAERILKVKTTTIHREISDIRAILNWAVKRKLIVTNPMAGFELPRRDDEIILPLSTDEVSQILAHSAVHLKRAMLLSYFLGLRRGATELLSMRYNQVNWNTNTIVVISAKKGGLQRREIPIHKDLSIEHWYKMDGEIEDKHIITYANKPIKSLKTAWKRAKERAGVKGRKMPMYALRHTFVTQLLHAGADIKTISDMAGHDPHTMIKSYAHTMSAVKRDAVDSLPGLDL